MDTSELASVVKNMQEGVLEKSKAKPRKQAKIKIKHRDGLYYIYKGRYLIAISGPNFMKGLLADEEV